MPAFSTKGVTFYLSKVGTTPTAVVPTAITTASPAVITVADVTGITKGDVVSFSETGFPELDGKSFLVGTVDGTANTFEATGADTTNSTGALGATPKASIIARSSGMQKICNYSVGISLGTPSTVSVGTFCDPSASIPGASAEAGTLELGVYHDVNDNGFKELLKAEADGKPVTLMIEWPNNQGAMIATGIITTMQVTDLPLDGSTAWTATMTLSSKPAFVF